MFFSIKDGKQMVLFSYDATYHEINLLEESLDKPTLDALKKCKNNGASVEVPQGCRMPGDSGCTRKALLHFSSYFTRNEVKTITNSMEDYVSLDSLSAFFAGNVLLKKNGLMVKGPSKWFKGNDTEVTDFLLSNGSRRVRLVIATIEDNNGYRTHNIAIDCKNRLLFDPDKFFENKTWPLNRETFKKLEIKKIHSARQIYREQGAKTLKSPKGAKKVAQPKIKGSLPPVYRR